MGVEAALLTTAVIGAGISAYGSYKEGMDAAEASRYNANVERENAAMIEASGALDASRKHKEVGRIIGTQKAAYGAAGVELTGSPLDVMINTAAEGELDARIIEYNAKVKSIGAISEADYQDRLAGIYERSGVIKAGSTLLTAASQIGTGYIGAGKSTSGQVYTGGKVKTGDYSVYKGY